MSSTVHDLALEALSAARDCAQEKVLAGPIYTAKELWEAGTLLRLTGAKLLNLCGELEIQEQQKAEAPAPRQHQPEDLFRS